MAAKKRFEKYIKFAVYLVLVVLVNLVGISLFFRLDLTKNGVYSLSDVSKQVVSTLTEPLTIKVFFTKNLKAPYNGAERYLRDLLEEYAIHGNRFFNYQFYDVTPQSDGVTSSSSENQQMAGSYGIQPLQIQELEQDEVKFRLAYMGLVIIHGDIVERIPALTSTDGLEYTLTTTFQKVNHKISTLLGLTENIQVRLMLSSSLKTVGPLMGLDDLPEIPETVEAAVTKLNPKNYNRLTYTFSDPITEEEQTAAMDAYDVLPLKWPASEENNVAAGNGVIGLVMSFGDNTVSLPILQAYRIPIFGTQYQLATPEEIEGMIADEVETLVNINENIGYLGDHGTLSLSAGSAASMMGQAAGGDLTTFNTLLGKTYSPKQFHLADELVPRDVRSIIIARPTEPFTDYELFQIDQALMRGQNLAIFLEPFKETSPEMSFMGAQNQQVSYEPIDTGLEKLLTHWGVGVKQSIVMDENCYAQTYSQAMGGGKQPIYYAPIIKSENIDQSLPIMHNIKEFLALKASPLVVNKERLSENNLTATVVFSSSEKAWEMEAPINLNPLYHTPPASEDTFEKMPLAVLIEGSFPSYFAGKPIPETAAVEKEEIDDDAGVQEESLTETDPSGLMSQVASEGGIIEKGKPAKIFLIGSGEMLRDDVIDEAGTTPNSMFVMNVIDGLNQREDIAQMRSKAQTHNPLNDTSALFKTSVKAFNIAGLPVLVVLFGIFVWMRRHSRRKAIQKMFETE